MAKSDDIEDLDKLIDRAVDTFFVEVSEEDEQVFQDTKLQALSKPRYRQKLLPNLMLSKGP